MVNANADALGIIFPNSYDEQVPDLVNERLMASIPFASRYRMVDFVLSSMANCGISKRVCRGAQELPLPDGPSGYRPRVGYGPPSRRSEHRPSLR